MVHRAALVHCWLERVLLDHMSRQKYSWWKKTFHFKATRKKKGMREVQGFEITLNALSLWHTCSNAAQTSSYIFFFPTICLKFESISELSCRLSRILLICLWKPLADIPKDIVSQYKECDNWDEQSQLLLKWQFRAHIGWIYYLFKIWIQLNEIWEKIA